MVRLAEAVLNPPNSLWYLVPVYCSLEVKSSAQYVSPVSGVYRVGVAYCIME